MKGKNTPEKTKNVEKAREEQKMGEKTIEKDIDIFGYICWVQNLMLLKNNKVGEVFDRLARYYGCNIIYDGSIENLLVSGKLDLQDG